MHKNNELFWAFVIAMHALRQHHRARWLSVRPARRTPRRRCLGWLIRSVTGALGFFAGRASLVSSSGKPDNPGDVDKSAFHFSACFIARRNPPLNPLPRIS